MDEYAPGATNVLTEDETHKKLYARYKEIQDGYKFTGYMTFDEWVRWFRKSAKRRFDWMRAIGSTVCMPTFSSDDDNQEG